MLLLSSSNEFNLPDETPKIGIRFYDASVGLEFREEPRQPKSHKSKRRAPMASGNCWVMHLGVALKSESVLVRSKRMLRRVESTTKGKPQEWFSYRNYFEPHEPGSSTARNVEFGDAFTHSFIGGYKWRFTGHLASAAFRNALGWDAVEQVSRTDQEIGLGQVVTRSHVATPKTGRGNKAAKRALAKSPRFERVQARSLREDTPEMEDDAAGDEWEIEGLRGKRTTRGKTSYKVEWSGNYC